MMNLEDILEWGCVRLPLKFELQAMNTLHYHILMIIEGRVIEGVHEIESMVSAISARKG